MNTYNSFLNIVKYGFLGSAAGFLNGIFFGVLIAFVTLIPTGTPEIQFAQVLFLGMGAGTVIGGVAGVFLAVKTSK